MKMGLKPESDRSKFFRINFQVQMYFIKYGNIAKNTGKININKSINTKCKAE